MSVKSPIARSTRPFLYGALAIMIAALLAAPALRKTYSAGKDAQQKGVTTAVSKRGEPETPPVSKRSPTTKEKVYPNIDVRVNEQSSIAPLVAANAPAISKQVQAQAQAIQRGVAALKPLSPGVEARLSPLTGAVEVLRNKTGALTGASPGNSGNDIVRSFIRANSGLYGLSRADIANLNFIGESVSQASGLRMVRVEQTVNGLPVFQSESRFILDADGRLFRSTGLIIPEASAKAPAVDVSELISAQEALTSAMGSVGIAVDASQATLADAYFFF